LINKLQHIEQNILAGNKTAKAKTRKPNFTQHTEIMPFKSVFSLNNDSTLTRAPLLGKWPIEEKYKYNKLGNFALEETLYSICLDLPVGYLDLH
jgi:hypothetical protein